MIEYALCGAVGAVVGIAASLVAVVWWAGYLDDEMEKASDVKR
ncbi:hypothetical protein [Burkholderia phage BCSR129]|nr:hypothetical protein [Burkholderia phage BCSR129]